MTFKRKLTLCCLFFTFIPLFCVTIGNVLSINKHTEDMYVEMLVQLSTIQHAYVQEIYKQSSSFRLCYVLNKQGKVIESNDPSMKGKIILTPHQIDSIIHTEDGFSSYMPELDGMALVKEIPSQPSNQDAYCVTIISSQFLRDMLKHYNYFDNGYSFFIDRNGKIIGYPDPAVNTIADLKDDSDTYSYLKNILEGNAETDSIQTLAGNTKYYYRHNIKKISIHWQLNTSGWYMVTTMDANNSVLYSETLLRQLAIIMTLSIVLLYILFKQCLIYLFVPFEDLLKTIKAVEKGEDSARFGYLMNDEMGDIATAFNQLIEKQLTMLKQLKESESRYRIVLEQSAEIIWEWRSGSRELYISDNWHRKCCQTLDAQHLSIDSMLSIIHPKDREKSIQAISKLGYKTPSCQFEIRIQETEDLYLWMLIRAKAIAIENHIPTRIVGVAIDIDDARRREKELLKLATYDQLTKAFNKTTFERKVRNALRLVQVRNQSLALLFIDVDYFKQINDSHGHDVGDQVLKDLALLMKDYVGKDGIIGRFGGDEFLICITQQDILSNLSLWIAGLEQKIESHHFVSLQGNLFHIGCSIGIAVFPTDGTLYEELIHKADVTMYVRKEQRKGEQ